MSKLMCYERLLQRESNTLKLSFRNITMKKGTLETALNEISIDTLFHVCTSMEYSIILCKVFKIYCINKVRLLTDKIFYLTFGSMRNAYHKNIKYLVRMSKIISLKECSLKLLMYNCNEKI